MIERAHTSSEPQPAKSGIKPLRLWKNLHNWQKISVFAVPIVVALAGITWRILSVPPANVDPFTAKVAGSVQFPLYHPTRLPEGYRTDPKSVTEPTAGVVVFNMVNSGGEKLFCSEEARPKNPDIGGAYQKLMDNPKSVILKDGSVTTGNLKNNQGVMGSRVNNKVWLLCNSQAKIPLAQIRTMLTSMALSY